MQGIGVSLIASGPFVTDPSPMFGQTSPLGVVHGIFGAMVFTFAPLSCFVFYRRFRSDLAWRRLAGWTLLSGMSSPSELFCSRSASNPEVACSNGKV